MKTSLTLLCALHLWGIYPLMGQSPHLPHAKHQFTVIAHRGNHVNAPENTLLAYDKAIRVGADYIEVDIRTTKDGQLVVMHDGTVDRTTLGHGKVNDLTLLEFSALQIRDERFPNLPALHPPTLEEVLRLAKGRIHLYLDDKDSEPVMQQHPDHNFIKRSTQFFLGECPCSTYAPGARWPICRCIPSICHCTLPSF